MAFAGCARQSCYFLSRVERKQEKQAQTHVNVVGVNVVGVGVSQEGVELDSVAVVW